MQLKILEIARRVVKFSEMALDNMARSHLRGEHGKGNSGVFDLRSSEDSMNSADAIKCSVYPVWIITAYDPTLNPEEWEADFKRRLKRS